MEQKIDDSRYPKRIFAHTAVSAFTDMPTWREVKHLADEVEYVRVDVYNELRSRVEGPPCEPVDPSGPGWTPTDLSGPTVVP